MIDNWFPKYTGKHWPWLMDMHLFYFTEESIRNILKQTGFEIIDERKYCHIVALEYLLTKVGTLGPYRGRLGLAWVIAPVIVGALILVAGYLALSR